jgi:anti-sigma regulatory factor (Ser/Thr protein kinase)
VRERRPHLSGRLQDFRVNQSRVQLFAMLVTEALTNAVDHGLLRLDSSLKGQGFEAYDQHRTLALETLEAGSVRLTVTLLQPEGPGQQPIRKITTEVADTGAGFDWRPWLQPAGDPGLRPFGRGIALLQALGTSLRFNAAGNALSFDLDCP